jgi:hypothetical protein
MNYLGKNIIFAIGAKYLPLEQNICHWSKIFAIGGKIRHTVFITPHQTEFAAVASSQTYLYHL